MQINQKGFIQIVVILATAVLLAFWGMKNINFKKLAEVLTPKVKLTEEEIASIKEGTKPNTESNLTSKIFSLFPKPSPSAETEKTGTKNCPLGPSYCLDRKTLIICFEDDGTTVRTTCQEGQGVCDSASNWCK